MSSNVDQAVEPQCLKAAVVALMLLQASGQELGSRKKKNADGTPAAPAAQAGPQKGQKFRARKSREAAAKAASQAGMAQPNGTAAEPEAAKAAAPATATSQLETVKVPDAPPRKD